MTTVEAQAKAKILLGIKDTLQDDVLTGIGSIVAARLRNRLYGHPETVPEELSYVLVEVIIARFNRLGSEHVKSDSEEGHTLTWYDNDDMFLPYKQEIDQWNREQAGNPTSHSTKGQVIFI